MGDKPTVLIMAAGKGTRMRSQVSKVLHPVCGRPMIHWVIDAARRAGADPVVCITRPGDGVAEGLPPDVTVVEQTEGEGTGSAVLAAREHLEKGTAVTLSGDHPLISAETIAELVGVHSEAGAAATLLTAEVDEPSGYGRIVRGPDGDVESIVETKSTEGVDAEILTIREVNMGAYAFDGPALVEALDQIPEDDSGERYLTAVFPLLQANGLTVSAHKTQDTSSAIGVNTRAGLIEVERHALRRLIDEHAREGVSFLLPETVYLDADITIGPDTEIGPGTVLRGTTTIGSGATIGPYTTVENSRIGDGAKVIRSHLVDCEVAANATIGPFAYLRPGADIGEDAKVGTFVEVKNSTLGRGAKVPHLSYIGDADVGEEANVAAGNITANYDGFAKHRTTIGKGARTGVNTSLVAPVTVGDGAYTGAGSVISDDVPNGALGISRPEQQNVEGYSERVKKERGK